ncbi:hypothetical protein [[Mycoplasma] phocae]|nr:hypothetical protein [[Mycoplasma] phocae]
MKNKITFIKWSEKPLISDAELAKREKRWKKEYPESEAIFVNTMKALAKM